VAHMQCLPAVSSAADHWTILTACPAGTPWAL
jgi:hypothetical protein